MRPELGHAGIEICAHGMRGKTLISDSLTNLTVPTKTNVLYLVLISEILKLDNIINPYNFPAQPTILLTLILTPK